MLTVLGSLQQRGPCTTLQGCGPPALCRPGACGCRGGRWPGGRLGGGMLLRLQPAAGGTPARPSACTHSHACQPRPAEVGWQLAAKAGVGAERHALQRPHGAAPQPGWREGGPRQPVLRQADRLGLRPVSGEGRQVRARAALSSDSLPGSSQPEIPSRRRTWESAHASGSVPLKLAALRSSRFSEGRRSNSWGGSVPESEEPVMSLQCRQRERWVPGTQQRSMQAGWLAASERARPQPPPSPWPSSQPEEGGEGDGRVGGAPR